MYKRQIYTLATLTGWAWVYFALQALDLQADIVLAKGDIRYIAPLAGVAQAKTSQTLITSNTDELTCGKNARFTIEVEICCGENTAAIFTGVYVAITQKN